MNGVFSDTVLKDTWAEGARGGQEACTHTAFVSSSAMRFLSKAISSSSATRLRKAAISSQPDGSGTRAGAVGVVARRRAGGVGFFFSVAAILRALKRAKVVAASSGVGVAFIREEDFVTTVLFSFFTSMFSST